MCTLAVQALAGVTHAELAGLLPTGHVWGRAGAAICLLSNLLEAGGPTLMVRILPMAHVTPCALL